MDREKIVNIATSILVKKSINLQDIILLLDSYCTENKKERKYIDLFIKTLVQLPYDIYSNLVDIALKYYMKKYAVCILRKEDNLNSIFNRRTQDNILLIY
jgi:hypothetical protein